MVKASIDNYRNTWLYSVALLTDTELPLLELGADCAEAAFSLVGYLEHTTGEEPEPVKEDDSESDTEEYRFSWDTPTVPAPRELMALWNRAKLGDNKISIKDLLEGFAPLEGLPNRPPENNLLPPWKKTQDSTFKVLSQQLLHILRIWAYRYEKKASVAVDLQLWQYTAEVYCKLQQERRELSSQGAASSSLVRPSSCSPTRT